MSRTSPVTETLKLAHAALLRIRTASIAGCEEGYGKPEKWADELFTSHGDVTKAMKAIEGILSSGHAQCSKDLPEFEDPRVQTVYEILCDNSEPPNPEEHWEGWYARRIVAALSDASTDLEHGCQ